jgi:hypothetical protein
MSGEAARQFLTDCEVGRIGTVGPDGTPYITPMHYAYDPEADLIYMHISPEKGHLLSNLEHSSKACFEADEPGALTVNGPEGCKASQYYRSVVCFGDARVVTDQEEKRRICWLLIEKYMRRSGLVAGPTLGPVDGIVCLEMQVQVMTGKEKV